MNQFELSCSWLGAMLNTIGYIILSQIILSYEVSKVDVHFSLYIVLTLTCYGLW
jgi:hypothetical protein